MNVWSGSRFLAVVVVARMVGLKSGKKSDDSQDLV